MAYIQKQNNTKAEKDIKYKNTTQRSHVKVTRTHSGAMKYLVGLDIERTIMFVQISSEDGESIVIISDSDF